MPRFVEMQRRLLPFLLNSRLGDRLDLLEDFSDFEEEFLLEAPVMEWVEFAESSRLARRPPPPPPPPLSSSPQAEEQEAERRRLRRRRLSSRPRDS